MNPREAAVKTLNQVLHPEWFEFTTALFLRLLGLIYLAAFGSLAPQIVGLVGSHGIAPAARLMVMMREQLGSRAWWDAPTLFWLNATDNVLFWSCILGCLAALFLVAGILSRWAAAICWILYLSLVSVGQPFTGFQWDALLLEAGFLALFAGSTWLVWGYRFLLFRLMFESGLVKLLSHDPNWRNLHALRFHFYTQPLPNPWAYYAAHLPFSVLDFLTGATLVIELAGPLLLFGPRRVRYTGVVLLVALQIIILLTGNYAFFNFLTIALCVWGLDDHFFRHLSGSLRLRPPLLRTSWLTKFMNAVVAVLILIGGLQLCGMIWPASFRGLTSKLEAIAPFQVVNTYGLFAVMTTSRPEIILEGSNDGTNWRAYSFPYKPGNLHRGLPVIAPYQPRLDWQMWFAALGGPQENSWVQGLIYRLLLGNEAVLHLLDSPPFPKPPRYMRALLYDYAFTTPTERSQTGAVWKRTLRGTWFGPVSLGGQ